MYENKQEINGVKIITSAVNYDKRGWLKKPFNPSTLKSAGIDFVCRESFASYSQSNVLRGVHFQAPPKPSAKIVTCLAGKVTDFLIDVRTYSTTYGNTLFVDLNPGITIYIPFGVGHGFYVDQGPAILVYFTDSPYDAALDSGIHWESIYDFRNAFAMHSPITSDRDKSMIDWNQFVSPFVGAHV